jgi:hypothetical protein
MEVVLTQKGLKRKYGALSESRFRITKVLHIDNKDDGNAVHDKIFDYSYKTIERMIKVGYQDASNQTDEQSKKVESIKLEH